MKPIVVFTNFWDANAIVKKGSFNCCFNETSECQHCNLELETYEVSSIALGIPHSYKIPALTCISRINCFLPTRELLFDYKEDKDWDKYRTKYRKLLVERKEAIESWLKRLESDKVYFLCCWEITSKTVHCHRELLFNVFCSTAIWKDKAMWRYRSGKK